jgi:hypothetical protein
MLTRPKRQSRKSASRTTRSSRGQIARKRMARSFRFERLEDRRLLTTCVGTEADDEEPLSDALEEAIEGLALVL